MSATDERRLATTPPPAPSDPASKAVRASDSEREATVSRLHQALGAGYLDLDETDERVAAAYAARHRDELHALLTDLPPAHATRSGAPTWAELWASAVWRARVTILGAEASTEAPTTEQTRTAVIVAALVVLWLVACAVLGAVLTR